MLTTVVLKQPGQLFDDSTYWKRQVRLRLHCTRQAGLLYAFLSQRVFISEIQTPSNQLDVCHQLVLTTLNENKEEWRLGSLM